MMCGGGKGHRLFGETGTRGFRSGGARCPGEGKTRPETRIEGRFLHSIGPESGDSRRAADDDGDITFCQADGEVSRIVNQPVRW